MAVAAKINADHPPLVHLLHRAVQTATDVFTEQVGSTNLTSRQLALLEALSANENVSQTALVNATGMDRSTLADVVRRLIKKGLIARSRSREDARAYNVRLTAAGRSALQSAVPLARQIDARLLETLPERRREVFLRDLETIASAFRKDDD